MNPTKPVNVGFMPSILSFFLYEKAPPIFLYISQSFKILHSPLIANKSNWEKKKLLKHIACTICILGSQSQRTSLWFCLVLLLNYEHLVGLWKFGKRTFGFEDVENTPTHTYRHKHAQTCINTWILRNFVVYKSMLNLFRSLFCVLAGRRGTGARGCAVHVD